MRERSKFLARQILIILCSALAVFIWNNRKNFSPTNVIDWIQNSVLGIGSGKGFPHAILGNKINKGNFKVLNRDIISVSDTSFLVLNKSAKELSNRQHSFGSPILKFSGSKMLIYNLYGNGFQIENFSKTIFKGNMENNIITASIADDGTYGFITESSGYFCEMTIFSDNSKDKKYKYYFSECYVTNMAFSDDGKNVAAIGYSAENGQIKSSLYVFDYKLSEPKLKMNFIGNALIDIAYLSNGNILVIGDNHSAFIDPQKEEKTVFDYDGRLLTNFNINKNEGVVFSLSSSSDESTCDILSLDLNGKKSFEINSEGKVTDLSCRGGNIMTLLYDKIVKYSPSGKKLKELPIKNDSKAIEMASPNSAYILGTSEIRMVTV